MKTISPPPCSPLVRKSVYEQSYLEPGSDVHPHGIPAFTPTLLSDLIGVRRKNVKQKITKPVALKNNNSVLNVSSGSNHSMLKLKQILEVIKQDQEKGESPRCDMKTLKLESDAADEMFQEHGRGYGSWDDIQRPFSPNTKTALIVSILRGSSSKCRAGCSMFLGCKNHLNFILRCL